jgi:hypothetical protein
LQGCRCKCFCSTLHGLPHSSSTGVLSCRAAGANASAALCVPPPPTMEFMYWGVVLQDCRCKCFCSALHGLPHSSCAGMLSCRAAGANASAALYMACHTVHGLRCCLAGLQVQMLLQRSTWPATQLMPWGVVLQGCRCKCFCSTLHGLPHSSSTGVLSCRAAGANASAELCVPPPPTMEFMYWGVVLQDCRCKCFCSTLHGLPHSSCAEVLPCRAAGANASVALYMACHTVHALRCCLAGLQVQMLLQHSTCPAI